ncbi:nitrate- and nitrite sensing domain-containing protein [Actinomycetospora chiangmaiensis]|uniref:nitrate- and nitrite sensing domain-containing protein n=1 Tax=Actinomycetospora chiangmaiensis TaxID=402650 RepID=UPI0003A40436|nr:nitrate- and nitrite sensing domain-containing protein [Actinomycetospora chiangmaiensis]
MTAPVRRTDARGEARGGVADPQARPPLGERLALRNWSLPVKLAAVLLVPTLFVITLGVLRIAEQTEKARSYDGVQQAVALESNNAKLLAALDAERRAAAVLLATNRAGGFGPVQEAADATNDQLGRLRSAYTSADSVDGQTRSAYGGAFSAVEGLDRVRDDVRGGAIDPAGAISRYTDATSAVLTFDESLTREAADPSIAGLSTGLYALSVVREQDAYVQAVVAAAIAGGRIDAPSIDQARNATLRRSIAVDEFRSAIGTDNAGLADAVVGAAVDQRDRLAQVVLGRGSAGLPPQVSAQDWDTASSAVQQQVTGVSDQLRTRLQANATSLQDGARNAAGVASVVLLLALMAGAAVVFFVTRSLLRPLRLLRRTALDVAERRLPDAVRSLREGEAPDTDVSRTPIETREEIGQVARAFDQVHEQAVRLAAEQAGLRSAYNSIFVNLSRRSQALVERQLRLIEQLENKEEDPEALGDLFQLDHLATRMRRNSENLLVLSGTDLARRGGRPVPLVDVLRAAASEVEQYQRVELAPPPSVQLLGRTAADVVHLVAELLENATAFSAPETRVDVSARPEPDGAVVLEIADSGVGMTDEDLADANQRLGSPPTVDVSASRRMGLFVVGRLAIRHGIGVTLRTREEGGVAAAVRIPASAVLSGAPGSSPGGGPSTRALGGTGLPVRSPGASPLGSPVGGAPRAETPGIPRQESREDVSGLPRRTAAARGAAGAAAAGVGAASFFSPAGAPEETSDPAPTEARTETPVESAAAPAGPRPADAAVPERRNGLTGALAAALPRRPVRPGAAPPEDPPSAPTVAPAAQVSAPQTDAADIDDEDDEDDDRVATVWAGGDDDGVSVWSQGAPAVEERRTPGVPERPVAAHAWRGPDGAEDEDEAPAGTVEEAGPPGRHGFRPQPGPGPVPAAGPSAERTTRDGRPAPRPRPTGWSDAPQGMPFGPGGPADPAGPPLNRPLPPRPSPQRPAPFPGAAAGPGPAPWGPPPDSGPRPPGSAPAPQPPMWNGAEVVPPPGPTASEAPEQDVETTGTDHAESVAAPVVEPTAPHAAAHVAPPDAEPEPKPEPEPEDVAPAEAVVVEDPAERAADEPAATASEPSAPDEAAGDGLPSRPSRRSLRPMAQRRRPEGEPLLRPGLAPRLRPRPADEQAEGEEAPAASAEELFAPGDDTASPGAPAPVVATNGVPTHGVPAHGVPAHGAHADGDHADGAHGVDADDPDVDGTAPEDVAPNGAPATGAHAIGTYTDSAPTDGAATNGAATNGAAANGAATNGTYTNGAVTNGTYTNGVATNGSATNGTGPRPVRSTPEGLPRRPAAVLPNRERTPIFDEVASVWFREAEPNAPDTVDPEWSDAGRPGFDAGAPSLTTVDAGTTESGLPRRRPRAQLVPGSARPSAPSVPGAAPEAPRRNAEAVRGRLASYQRGVADGRSTRPGPYPDGGPAADTNAIEEEQ